MRIWFFLCVIFSDFLFSLFLSDFFAVAAVVRFKSRLVFLSIQGIEYLMISVYQLDTQTRGR